MSAPLFLPLGDAALTVQFGDVIDDHLMAQVQALDAALIDHPLDGIYEAVPTYRSLTIHFDPLSVTPNEITAHITTLLQQTTPDSAPPRRWSVPVCYDGDHALDAGEYDTQIGLPFDDIKALHVGAIFKIAMFGFMPGCAYLSGLPKSLHIPRRATPRPQVPAGSIIIGGQQAMLSSIAMPTGWYMIGQTPVSIFDPNNDPVTPFNVGDEICFRAITDDDWNSAKIEALS